MYTGIQEIILDNEQLSQFYQQSNDINSLNIELSINEYLIIKDKNNFIYDEKGNKVYKTIDKFRMHKDNNLCKLKTKTINNPHLGKIKPLNDYQECMVDMILDNSITVKSIMGIPGGGKSFLFITYGLDKVIKGEINRVVYVKNNVDIGHEKLGSIPGGIDEKLDPWAKVLEDVFVDKLYVDKYKSEGKIVVEYIGHTVGRTYNDTFLIIDDSQQLSKKHVYNLTTRIGHNSVICFAGDLYQTYSSKYENGNNGMKFLINQLKGQDFFATVHTTKSERSEAAQRCAELLFEGAFENKD